jgi:hypothetical protein
MEGIAMKELGRTGMELGRILDKDLFSYIFDLEVKRARRYQNFISILMLHLSPLAGGGGENSLKSCHQTLSYILSEEARETDILGSLGESRFAALLPYADVAAGSQAKTRFENTLKYYDFRSKGYRVAVQQFCFPSYGTVISDFIQTTLSSNPLGAHELKSPVPSKLDN